MMRKEIDHFCVCKGTIIPKKQFLNHALKLKRIEENFEGYRLSRYFYSRNRNFPVSKYGKSFSQLNIRSFLFSDIPELIYRMRLVNIDECYDQYASIVDKFRITNPGGQHTSSFHPITLDSLEEHRKFKMKIFKYSYVNHDLSTPGK